MYIHTLINPQRGRCDADCVHNTQYGSTVYIGIAMGGQHYTEISVFTFSFNLNMSSKDIKVENM